MEKQPIKNSKAKRALIVVDVQPGFVKGNRKIVASIAKLIRSAKYDLYIEARFHAEKGSIWDMQIDWTFPFEETVPEILAELSNKQNVVRVIKETKSVFGGDKNIDKLLAKNAIREAHIVGFDTNDCVLATAFDSFDSGFLTYVIEKCTASSEGAKMRSCALALLRHAGLVK